MFDFLSGNVSPSSIYNTMEKGAARARGEAYQQSDQVLNKYNGMADDVFGKYGDIDRIDTSWQNRTGREMFDPNSQYNQGMLNSMQGQNQTNMAQQNLESQRMASMGRGFGATQRQQAGAQRSNQALNNGFNQHMGQAASIGSGMLGQAMQGDMANQRLDQAGVNAYANMQGQGLNAYSNLRNSGANMYGQGVMEARGAEASQRSQNAQNTAGLWQGIVGAGVGGLTQGLIGSIGGKVAGAASGNAGTGSTSFAGMNQGMDNAKNSFGNNFMGGGYTNNGKSLYNPPEWGTGNSPNLTTIFGG